MPPPPPSPPLPGTSDRYPALRPGKKARQLPSDLSVLLYAPFEAANDETHFRVASDLTINRASCLPIADNDSALFALRFRGYSLLSPRARARAYSPISLADESFAVLAVTARNSINA